MFCTECGNNIASIAKFCPQCGAKVVGESTDGASANEVQASVPIVSPPTVNTFSAGGPEASQNSAHASTTHASAPAPDTPPASPQPISAIQVNVGVDMGRSPNFVMMVAPKSLALAIILALFFGPIGMLYSTVKGAVIMFFGAILLVVVTFGAGFFLLLFMNPICAVWAAIATNAHNDALAAGMRQQ